MKKNLTLIVFAAYLLALVLVFLGSKLYVNKKSNRLHSEAIENFEKFFSKQVMYVNIAYSGEKVAYEQTSIPKLKPTLSFNLKKEELNWKETYGDIYKLYKLIPKYTSNNIFENDNQWSGWMFQIIEKTSDSEFCEYQICPYQVGFKKQEEQWMYNYIPSVQKAIDESFTFHSEDKKSSYANFINKNASINYYDVVRAVENKYYFLFSYDELAQLRGKDFADSIISYTDWEKYGIYCFRYKRADRQYTGDYGYMYNGFYRVYNKIVPQRCWQILYDYRFDNKTKDRNRILIWGAIILTILLMCYIIPRSITETKRKRISGESLKEKLIRLCNPKNYLKPYNKEKIEKANMLYAQLISTDTQDEDTLKQIRKQAIVDLGVEFFEKEKLADLIKQCNPQNFMNPYNAEKVKLSNELFYRISSEKLDIDEFEEIEKKIQELYL